MPQDFKDFPAPWEVCPEIPKGSIHWRMGHGEDVMARWAKAMRGLSPEQRLVYRETHLAPPEWAEGFHNYIAELNDPLRETREADKREIAGNIPGLGVREFIRGWKLLSRDRAVVETMAFGEDEPPSGHIYEFKRAEHGWTLQESLTRRWTL